MFDRARDAVPSIPVGHKDLWKLSTAQAEASVRAYVHRDDWARYSNEVADTTRKLENRQRNVALKYGLTAEEAEAVMKRDQMAWMFGITGHQDVVPQDDQPAAPTQQP